MKKKMVKGLVCGLIMSSLLGSMMGCGAKSATTNSVNAFAPMMQDAASYDEFEYKGNGNVFGAAQENMAAASTDVAPPNPNTSSAYSNTNQKLIRTKNISAETKEFDHAIADINIKVNELSGYIENSSTRGTGRGYNLRTLNMTIRIPSKNLDAFVQSIEGTVAILNTSESARDVTLSYVDMESHVKALRVEQEALMQLLQKAEDLDDIIRIQSQLTNVRYEIESYESSLRTLQNQVDYATVILNVSEVETETPIIEEMSFGEEMMMGLRDNLETIGMGLRDFALWFIVSIPYFVIWGVIIFVVVFVAKKIMKKRKAKKAAKQEVSVNTEKAE